MTDGHGMHDIGPRYPQVRTEVFLNEPPPPVPMILTCPVCSARHIDEGEFAAKAHHTHACQSCGMVWRPAIVPTVGGQVPAWVQEPLLLSRPSQI